MHSSTIAARNRMSPVVPPRRKDGKCACGCGRDLPPIPKHANSMLRESLLRDPFASTECAKAYYGVSFKPEHPAKGGGRGKAHRDGEKL